MQYTDLVFDLYGTLVDIHTDENNHVWEKTALYFSYYGAHYTGKSLKAAFESEMRKREAIAGQSYEVYPDIPFDRVLADLFRARHVTESADALGLNAAQLFRIESTAYIRLYDDVMQSLETLRRQGLRLWLLSNAQRAFTAYELVHLGLGPQFDGIYLSSDYQCRKPDLRFFQALINDHQLDPVHTLMIGNDLDTDIAGAKEAGLATLYMHTNLTPSHQRTANSACVPGKTLRRHYEFEGADWRKLTQLLCNLC